MSKEGREPIDKNDRLDLHIENFRHGIKDQVASFSAMDVKASIFVSTLVAALIFVMKAISDSGIREYHLACQVIILALGSILFFSFIFNIVVGFLAIKGREMKAGVLEEHNISDLGDKNVREEVRAQLNRSYKDNKVKHGVKSRHFKTTEFLWPINFAYFLIFMLILTVLELVYG